MKIKELSRKNLNNALPLVWDVFSKYEAKNYTESGKQVFLSAIHSEEYLDSLTAYGAFACALATFSAVQEGHYIRTKRKET